MSIRHPSVTAALHNPPIEKGEAMALPTTNTDTAPPTREEPNMTIDHAESQAIIPDAMRTTADAYQSSPAVSVAGGRLIFVSGQVGVDETGQPIADPEAQFVTAIENLREILEAAGGTLADVVEMTTYFTSIADLPVFAKVKERFFTTTPYPAWTGIGVNELALPGLRVEIKATASPKNPAGPQR
jgi:enamine deaminase RidA (YjgF/YER057c/UK114 family)